MDGHRPATERAVLGALLGLDAPPLQASSRSSPTRPGPTGRRRDSPTVSLIEAMRSFWCTSAFLISNISASRFSLGPTLDTSSSITPRHPSGGRLGLHGGERGLLDGVADDPGVVDEAPNPSARSFSASRCSAASATRQCAIILPLLQDGGCPSWSSVSQLERETRDLSRRGIPRSAPPGGPRLDETCDVAVVRVVGGPRQVALDRVDLLLDEGAERGGEPG